MKRKFKLSLKPQSGTINMFYAFLNGKRIISGEGTKKFDWEGEISADEVKLKIRVTGINNAEYKVSIDLPGTVNDQELTFQLTGGYHEFEIYL